MRVFSLFEVGKAVFCDEVGAASVDLVHEVVSGG